MNPLFFGAIQIVKVIKQRIRTKDVFIIYLYTVSTLLFMSVDRVVTTITNILSLECREVFWEYIWIYNVRVHSWCGK